MTDNPFITGNPFVPAPADDGGWCGWGFEYVRKGDEVVVVWPSDGKMQGLVISIDDEWIYLKGVGSNAPLRAPLKSLRLKAHLVNEDGKYVQSMDPPAYRLASSNPFMVTS